MGMTNTGTRRVTTTKQSMTAAEHVAAAEALLAIIEPTIGKAVFAMTPVHLVAAQVHATLALAIAQGAR